MDQHQCVAAILPLWMTVAWKSDPIGCKGSDPDVNQADALHIKVGSTDFPRCQVKLKISGRYERLFREIGSEPEIAGRNRD